MNRSELIKIVAQAHPTVSPDRIEAILDTYHDTIMEKLRAGENVTIARWGRYEMRSRQAKQYTNPKTGKREQLPAKQIVGFKASSLLKSKVEGSAL